MNKLDLLSDIFATLKLRSDIYFRAELAGAFAIEVPAERRRIRFHLVRHGACWVKIAAMPDPVRLSEGDLVIIPRGVAQVLRDDPDRPTVPLGQLLQDGAVNEAGVLTYGTGEGGARLLCGFCGFDELLDHPVIAGLPDMIVIKPRELGAEPWAAATLRLLTLEADLGAQGMGEIMSRLLEIVLVQTVRRMPSPWDGAALGYVTALKDPQLSKALLAIHNEPHLVWTIGDLAKAAGMSRARFAKRFAALVGLPPIAYLTNWRLMKACRLLRDTGLGTGEIAARCGYASLPSFSRRFKSAFGIGPGAYRRGAGSGAV